MNFKDFLREANAKFSDEQLYKIALQVGKREFGSSSQGFVHESKLKEVHRIKASKAEKGVGTYGWVFYPSDPSKFHDYSDKEFSAVPPDVDGLVYAAESDGNMFIVSGSRAKPKDDMYRKMFKEAVLLKGWHLEHADVDTGFFTCATMKTYDFPKVQIDVKNGKWQARAYRFDNHITATHVLKLSGDDLTSEKVTEIIEKSNDKFKNLI